MVSHAVKATDLMDFKSPSLNAFVEVGLCGQVRRTRTVWDTKHPSWVADSAAFEISDFTAMLEIRVPTPSYSFLLPDYLSLTYSMHGLEPPR